MFWCLRVRWSPFLQPFKWVIAVCPFLLARILLGLTRSGKASVLLVAFNQTHRYSCTNSHPGGPCVAKLCAIVSPAVSMHPHDVPEGRGQVAWGFRVGLGGPTPCVNIWVALPPASSVASGVLTCLCMWRLEDKWIPRNSNTWHNWDMWSHKENVPHLSAWCDFSDSTSNCAEEFIFTWHYIITVPNIYCLISVNELAM